METFVLCHVWISFPTLFCCGKHQNYFEFWTQQSVKKHGIRCGSPVGWLQAIEPVVTVTIQTSLRCPVGHRSRDKTQQESLEPTEDNQVHWNSSTEHSADHPGPFTCAEKRLSGRDCKEKKLHTLKIKLPNLLLPAYLRCMSANLWCNIPSGVANADHYHPLPSEGGSVFVIPAVNARPSKSIMSWSRKCDVMWNLLAKIEISNVTTLFLNLGSPIEAVMDGRIGPNTPALHQRRVSPPFHPCPQSQPPTDRKLRNLAFVRWPSLWSEVFFQCKCYIAPMLQPSDRNVGQTNLKPNVSAQAKVIRIKPEILQQLWIVQVVRKLSRHWEIAEAHDLLGGVGHQGTVDAGLVRLCWLLHMERES